MNFNRKWVHLMHSVGYRLTYLIAIACGLTACAQETDRQPSKQVTEERDDVVYLDDLKEQASEIYYGVLGKHGATGFPNDASQRCRLNPGQQEVAHSLSMTPKPGPILPGSSTTPTYVVYELDKPYTTFQATVAINMPIEGDGLAFSKRERWKGNPDSPTTFRVIGDNKLLWESRQIAKQGENQNCEVSILGVKYLRLEVTCTGSDRFAWSFWANPRLIPAKSVEPPEASADTAPASMTEQGIAPDTNEELSSEAALDPHSLATLFTDKIEEFNDKLQYSGKVAKVTPQIVYLSIGNATGVRVGDTIKVFRSSGEIVDPDTGKVLGAERVFISQLEVSEVSEAFAKAKFVTNFEAKIENGDAVESANQMIVAVGPFVDGNGDESELGKVVSEEVTTCLVSHDLKVVERAKLAAALKELLIQNTILFDSKSAQRFGELVGANYVVIGQILEDNKVNRAFLRLVDVQSGKIILASSEALKSASPDMTSQGNSAKGPGGVTSSTASSAGSGTISPVGAGLDKGLPEFMTTNSLFRRTAGKGIRFQGTSKGAVRTKESNFVTKDFSFEVLVDFRTGDRVAEIGFGPGVQDQSYNGLKDCVYLRLHSQAENGEVQLERFRQGNEVIGRLSSPGPYLVRIVKQGESVLFQVDAGNDGMSDDDVETTVANIRDFATFLHSKNSPLFFGGNGDFISVSLE